MSEAANKENVMGNIQVKSHENPKAAPIVPARDPRLEPFRALRELMAWDPFREMQMLSAPLPGVFAPSFEVKETKDGFVFKADIPGVKESDVDVTLTGNRLAISGKRHSEHEDKTDTYYAYERSYGDFSRTFTLPDGIDGKSMAADLKDGVLTVSVAKTPEASTRKIPIQTQAKKS